MTATFEGTATTLNGRAHEDVTTIERIPESDPTGLEPAELGGEFVLREVRRAREALQTGLRDETLTEAEITRLQAIYNMANRALSDVIGEQHNGIDGQHIVRAYN
jgi:hypothetical protein